MSSPFRPHGHCLTFLMLLVGRSSPRPYSSLSLSCTSWINTFTFLKSVFCPFYNSHCCLKFPILLLVIFLPHHFHFLTLLPYVETLVKGFYGGPAYKQVFTRSFIDLSEAEIFAHNAFPATVTSSQRCILFNLHNFLFILVIKKYVEVDLKRASLMHVAPRIAVHCCPITPDVAPDMPQMMLLSTADIKDCLQMAHSCVW